MSSAPPTCTAPGCGAPATSRCSRCMSAHYCGAACQRAHWAAHKPICGTSFEYRTVMTDSSEAGVDADIERSGRAAAAHDAQAQARLAACMLGGVGVPRDIAAGRALLARAAAGGSACAQYSHAVYLLADGIGYDDNEIRRWVGLAATQGYKLALRALADWPTFIACGSGTASEAVMAEFQSR